MRLQIYIQLFLDDQRMPKEASGYATVRGVNPDIYEMNWVIVQSYDEFRDWILKHGLPDMISFDYDLGEDDAKKKVAKGISKKKARLDKKLAKSGFGCARWLVNHCIDRHLDLPKWAVHSANEIGYKKIKLLLDNFESYKESGF